MNEILSVLVTDFEPIYLLDVVTPELDIIDLAFTIPLTPNIANSGDSSEQISLDPCLISQDADRLMLITTGYFVYSATTSPHNQSQQAVRLETCQQSNKEWFFLPLFILVLHGRLHVQEGRELF
jgi:hypothetical protein